MDWVASHPPLWDHVSLKLSKGTKLSLRRFCLGLFRYRSVRSAPPPSKILDPPLGGVQVQIEKEQSRSLLTGGLASNQIYEHG